jgi:hypothetical protein
MKLPQGIYIAVENNFSVLENRNKSRKIIAKNNAT